MTHLMQRITLASFLLLISWVSIGQMIKPGQWRGVIHYSDAIVPFTFEVSYPGGPIPRFTFINGQERRQIDEVNFRNDSLVISFTPFDVEISAAFTAISMEGHYSKPYRGAAYRFTAEYGKSRQMKKSVRSSPPLESPWEMTFEEGKQNEVQRCRVIQANRPYGDRDGHDSG